MLCSAIIISQKKIFFNKKSPQRAIKKCCKYGKDQRSGKEMREGGGRNRRNFHSTTTEYGGGSLRLPCIISFLIIKEQESKRKRGASGARPDFFLELLPRIWYIDNRKKKGKPETYGLPGKNNQQVTYCNSRQLFVVVGGYFFPLKIV